MRKIVLLSCGKSKIDGPSRSRDLYTGDLFKKSLIYAQAQSSYAIYILSAKHGLLELDEIIVRYEMTLNKMRKHQRDAWAKRVLSQLHFKTDVKSCEYVFLAGQRYREGLIPHLNHCSIPMDGLRLGQQLNWLKEKNNV